MMRFFLLSFVALALLAVGTVGQTSSPTGSCMWSLAIGPGFSSQYVVSVPTVTSGNGIYTLTAFAKVSSDYDGERIFMRSLWYDVLGNLLSTQNNEFDEESWPTEYDEYHFISEIYNARSAPPASMKWLVGFPGDNTKGSRYITHLQMTGPDGKKYLIDGDFAGGQDLALYDPSASSGDFEVIRDCSTLTYNPTFAPSTSPHPTKTPTLSSAPTVLPSSAPTNACIWALEFGQGDSQYTVATNISSGNGKYVLSAFAKFSSDYDGEPFFMRSEWFDAQGKLLSTQNLNFDAEAWPPAPSSEYSFISEIYDARMAPPASMKWRVGYPSGNTKGFKYITGLQITGPDGLTYIENGDFKGKQHLNIFDPADSFGNFSIIQDCTANTLDTLTYAPTSGPSSEPTLFPTFAPSATPSYVPSPAPSTAAPSGLPTAVPTYAPTILPTSGPTPAPTSPPSAFCVWALEIEPGTDTQYVVSVPTVTSGNGIYTLTAYAKYSADYDGEKIFMRSLWYDVLGNLLSTQNNAFDPESWPTEPDEYHFISEIYNARQAPPASMKWLVGFPGDNTAGSRFITNLQITGPDGAKYILDGDFPAGNDLALFDPAESSGDFGVIRDCPVSALTYTPTAAPIL